jgi:hypothetical protein
VQRAPTKPGNWELMLSLLILVKEKNGGKHSHERKERTLFHALGENRLEDEAEIFMQEYRSSCVEAGRHLDISVCEDD